MIVVGVPLVVVGVLLVVIGVGDSLMGVAVCVILVVVVKSVPLAVAVMVGDLWVVMVVVVDVPLSVMVLKTEVSLKLTVSELLTEPLLPIAPLPDISAEPVAKLFRYLCINKIITNLHRPM